MQPGLSVLIPTYKRVAIVIETIYRLKWNLKYDGQIQILVGVDAPDGTWECLNAMRSGMPRISLVPLRGPRLMATQNEYGMWPGLGANLNMLIESAAFPYLMQMDDDHWLMSELDLNPHVTAMGAFPNIGWVRLMGVSAHKYMATMYGAYWYVDWHSPEVYIPSNRPHLKHRKFHDKYGMYPTYQTMGATEEGFGHQAKAIALAEPDPTKRLYVTVPVSLHEELWDHVGQSWQGVDE